jgi:alkylation response protein AidB-like acyl-CoA dehydrogenase
MNLQENPADAAFRAEVRAFVAAKLPPDLRRRVLDFHRLGREDHVLWQTILHAQGWGAPGWPTDYGGTGWTAMQRLIFDEECCTAGAPRQIPFGLNMVGPVIQKFGSAEQKSRFLPAILDFSTWWCQGYSEPGAGSDLVSLKTRAVRQGDTYVVEGQKTWTSFAQWADWIFCLVKTSTEHRPQESISFLLIDMRSPGVTVRPIRTLDGGANVNEVFFDKVEVPAENLVGQENQGWTYAKYLLGHERTTIAGIGMCKLLLLRAKEIAGTEQHRGRPLIEDPRIRQRLARIEIELMAHEWSVLRLISAGKAGQDMGAQASVLKIRGSEIQTDLAELLMDCVGPDALPYLKDALAPGHAGELPDFGRATHLTGQYFELRKLPIYGGTNEIQKNIIAKTVLGL